MALGSRGKNVELSDQDLCNSPILEPMRIQRSIRSTTHVTGSAAHMENYLACFFSIEPWHVLCEHWFQHILDKNFTKDRSVWRNEVQAGLASPCKTGSVQSFLTKSRSRSCNRWSWCSFRLRFLCVINWTLAVGEIQRYPGLT